MPKMIAGAVSDKDVCFLVRICAWNYRIYYTYKVLFEGFDGDKPKYGNIAPNALGDLASMLKAQIILDVCKLTDREKNYRGNENLSIRFFTECADFGRGNEQLEALKALREIRAELEAFGEKLKPARDKILSHSDRETAHAGQPLGAASEKDWEAYWSSVDCFIKILTKSYAVQAPSIFAATAGTDAASLRGVLEEWAARGDPLPMPKIPRGQHGP